MSSLLKSLIDSQINNIPNPTNKTVLRRVDRIFLCFSIIYLEVTKPSGKDT